MMNLPAVHSGRVERRGLHLTHVTVGIKALNEERHIRRSLESALLAVRNLDGEVILADSGSRDRTIEIARQLPVLIVQLADPQERCCGAGAQLAYQHARGEYFYLLDGDMELDPDFLAAGIAFLASHPEIAAVGGYVEECNVQGEDFQIRANAVRRDARWQPGEVDRLDCGGLYRADAVREVDYFADRNLHAFEEFELGARLQAAGWKLARIDHPAVKHYGHTTGGYRMLWRRLRSGYAGGAGEVLRAALGKPHQGVVLRRLTHIAVGFAVMAWWGLLAASAVLKPLLLPLLVGLPLLFLMWRRRSWRLGLYSLFSWNIAALGLLQGLFRGRVSPQHPLKSVVLSGVPAPRT